MLMAEKKTSIQITAVYDGELDATDVFVEMIARKQGQAYIQKEEKEHLAISQDAVYNKEEVQKTEAPSGLCG